MNSNRPLRTIRAVGMIEHQRGEVSTSSMQLDGHREHHRELQSVGPDGLVGLVLLRHQHRPGAVRHARQSRTGKRIAIPSTIDLYGLGLLAQSAQASILDGGRGRGDMLGGHAQIWKIIIRRRVFKG